MPTADTRRLYTYMIRAGLAHGEQPNSALKPEGSLEVGVKVGFLDVL